MWHRRWQSFQPGIEKVQFQRCLPHICEISMILFHLLLLSNCCSENDFVAGLGYDLLFHLIWNKWNWQYFSKSKKICTSQCTNSKNFCQHQYEPVSTGWHRSPQPLCLWRFATLFVICYLHYLLFVLFVICVICYLPCLWRFARLYLGERSLQHPHLKTISVMVMFEMLFFYMHLSFILNVLLTHQKGKVTSPTSMNVVVEPWKILCIFVILYFEKVYNLQLLLLIEVLFSYLITCFVNKLDSSIAISKIWNYHWPTPSLIDRGRW